MNLNKRELIQFNDEGYLILRQVISQKNISLILDAISVMAKNNMSNHQSLSLSEIIIQLEQENHSNVYNIQKAMSTSFNAMRVITDLDLDRAHSQLYDVSLSKVHTHLFQTPVQFPKDARFDFSWHQESASYSGNFKILTCWFPLIGAVNRIKGSVEFIPGSHLNGKRKMRHEKKDSGLNDWIVDPNKDELKKARVAELEPGDILLFDSDILHRSMANQSQDIRITGISRTVNICELDKILPMAEPVNYMDSKFKK